MIVVDASLATKWLLVERDSDAALGLLSARQHELCAPDILIIEVCGALVTAANQRRIDRLTAEEKIGAWLAGIERGNWLFTSLTSD